MCHHPVSLFMAQVSILKAQGITPGSNSISSDNFVSAIQSGFGGSPVVECKSGQLTVVGLCFSKDLAPQDCASTLTSSCGSELVFPAAK